MIKKRFSYLIFCFVLLLIAFLVRPFLRFGISNNDVGSKILSLIEIQEIFPSAHRQEVKTKPDQWSFVFDKEGKPLGKIIYTSPFVIEKGYADEVPLLIAADLEGRIIAVRLEPHQETPEVVRRLKAGNFLRSWDGLTARETLTAKVDAVTGATMTSGAIIRAFQKRLSLLEESKKSALGRVSQAKAISASAPVSEPETNFHLARFFKTLANGLVQCELCPHRCTIREGAFGFCRARKNIKGRLYALTYGQPVALHVDPIEKKPFAHVYPGTRSFSLATAGCNLRCKFCQNWEISQLDADKVESAYVAPREIIAQAKASGSKTIAFTYTEPFIFYEYMLAIAQEAKAQGVACVMHSAGFVNEAPLRELAPYLLAANIDLKGFDEKFYTAFTGGHLETVLNTLKILKEEGVWIEITNLLIPGANDSDEMIGALCVWVRDHLGKDTPVHFSRFYPMYKLIDLSPTPVATLKRAYDIAKKAGLAFVYIGNVPETQGEDTFCPVCGKLLIKREGYTVLENYISDGQCPACHARVPGIWN